MIEGRFDLTFEQLPKTLPVFPLSGVLLLPRAPLPLNIFEPRYLNMTRDAMGAERMIGMIQPTVPEKHSPDDRPEMYTIGCAGRITSFTETKDDRYLITLTGVCRFDVVDELPVMNGYRRVVASYDRYRGDLEGESAAGIDCDRLLAALKAYLKVKDFQADWDAIDQTPDEYLVTALAMTCPFAPSEKQVLLESPNLIERSRVMTTLFEMAALDRGGASQLRH